MQLETNNKNEKQQNKKSFQKQNVKMRQRKSKDDKQFRNYR